jgi:DNA-binding transcriptional LysR family regulator
MLQRLEGFYWVARHQGYARAARAFPYPITQPGVHQQISRLEEELGVKLFERTGKDRVVLTAAGRALHAFVAPFLEQLPLVVASLKEGSFAGTLRIGASGLVLRHLLPPWLRRVKAKRPEIDVALSELKMADLPLLRSGEVDLLVDHLPEVPDDVAVRRVGEARTFIALPSDHPLASKRTVALPELTGEPFIAYHADLKSRELQLRALERFGGPPGRMHAADSAESILGLVAAGIGWSLVPWLSGAGPRVAGVVTRPLDVPGAAFPIYATWRRAGPPNPFVQAALDLVPPP